MHTFLFRWKKQLVGLLLFTFVVSPFSVAAQTPDENVWGIIRQLSALGEALDKARGVSIDERLAMAAQIRSIFDQLVALYPSILAVEDSPAPAPYTPPPTSPTQSSGESETQETSSIQIIVDDSSERTEAQFENADGEVVTAEFYFTGEDDAPATEEEYVAATIDRTAETFNLDSAELSENPVVVSSFTDTESSSPYGDFTYEDVLDEETLADILAANTDSSDPSSYRAPEPEDPNIESVLILGNVGDYNSQAIVTYTAESGLPERTFNYQFASRLAKYNYDSRLRELTSFTYGELSKDLGVSSGFLRQKGTVSHALFDNESEVLEYLAAVKPGSLIGDQAFSTEDQGSYTSRISSVDWSERVWMSFGTYSIIESVEVVAGAGIYRVVARSDQNEELIITMTQHVRDKTRTENPERELADEYNFNLVFKVHGVPIETIDINRVPAENIRPLIADAIKDSDVAEAVEGLDLTSAEIEQLVWDFVFNNRSYYLNPPQQLGERYDIYEPSSDCHSGTSYAEAISDALATDLARLAPVQYEGNSLEELINLYAPIAYNTEDPTSGCLSADDNEVIDLSGDTEENVESDRSDYYYESDGE